MEQKDKRKEEKNLLPFILQEPLREPCNPIKPIIKAHQKGIHRQSRQY